MAPRRPHVVGTQGNDGSCIADTRVNFTGRSGADLGARDLRGCDPLFGQRRQHFLSGLMMNVDDSQFLSTMSGGFRPQAHWRSCSGRGVSVAVIDSGIDRDHPDLKGRLAESVEARVEGKRVVFEPSKSGDSAGHGTACAGIIAKVAPDARLNSIKVLGAAGLGDGNVFLAGLEYA